MPEIFVLPKWTKTFPLNSIIIDTTSSSGDFRDLSPFVLGSIKTYVPNLDAKNFENLWQYSKVYKCHTTLTDSDMLNLIPSKDWYVWRNQGWLNTHAVRYPMGKGAKPEFSWWNGKKLTYIQARKQIYAPIYAEYVQKTDSFKQLSNLYFNSQRPLFLLDYDAYDHRALNKSLVDVINDSNRKCGHAFILMMILTNTLNECIKDKR